MILNVTATAPTDNSYISVYPDGGSQPVVSNLNVTPGQTIPNLVIVPVGADGAVNLYNHTGTTDLLVDVEGYYTSGQSGLKFHPSAPHRVLDTRDGDGVAAGQPAPIGADTTLGLPVGDDVRRSRQRGPITTSGGVVLNVIATDTTAQLPQGVSVQRRFPDGVEPQLHRRADHPQRRDDPGQRPFVNFYNHAGSVDVVADLFGYFATSEPATSDGGAGPWSCPFVVSGRTATVGA